MRFLTLAATAAIALSAFSAQAATQERHGRRAHQSHNAVDQGATTPDADRAYMGGGMVLEGAPGAPAPMPQPTPPGQTPRNMVPMR